MYVAGLQYDIVWEDKAANHAAVAAQLEALRSERVPAGALVVLPELGDTGFSFNLDKIADGTTVPWTISLATQHNVGIVTGWARRGPDGRGRNCATIVAPNGDVLGTYEKVHPFSFGREIEFFSGGQNLLLVEFGGAVVCPMVCYDLRFPELWRCAAVAGAEVFVIGASWPATRHEHWRQLLIARAIENQAYVVAVNRCGADPHLPYRGGSMIVTPHGEIIAEAGTEAEVVAAELDLTALRDWRTEFPALRDIHPELLGTFPIERRMSENRDAPPA